MLMVFYKSFTADMWHFQKEFIAFHNINKMWSHTL